MGLTRFFVPFSWRFQDGCVLSGHFFGSVALYAMAIRVYGVDESHEEIYRWLSLLQAIFEIELYYLFYLPPSFPPSLNLSVFFQFFDLIPVVHYGGRRREIKWKVFN